MLILEIRFPSGRFHATPWDAHANEGRVEWPPSPFRLLRALISVAYTRVHTFDEALLERLVSTLSAELPLFRLPPATTGHIRHYVPDGTDKKDGEFVRSKLFDTFVHTDPDDPVLVVYQTLVLDADERALLDQLLAELTYLGRAESWADVRIGDAWDGEVDAWPVTGDEAEASGEPIRYLVAVGDDELRTFRETHVEHARAEAAASAIAKGKVENDGAAKLSKKEIDGLSRGLTVGRLDTLSVETAALSSDGWARPPGTRWQTYGRRAGLLEPRIERKRAPRLRTGPRVIRFAVDSAVLPSLKSTVHVAERMHMTLAKWAGARVVGVTDSGEAAQGHAHAHVFCEPDARGRIAGISLYVPAGLDDTERGAIDRIERLWGNDGHDLHLILTQDVAPTDAALVADASAGSPYFGTSAVWESVTPFLNTRHPKSTRAGVPKLDDTGYQIGSPEHDLLRLLTLAGHPTPRVLQRLDAANVGGRETRWLAFRTERQHGGGRRGAGLPLGFRLVFAEPVTGPIAVGYGAHFGLGAFRAVRSARVERDVVSAH